MGKKLKNMPVFYLVIFFILNLIGCNSPEKEIFAGKTFEQTFDVRINNIFNFAKKNVSQSSDHDDYLMGLEHNKDYTYIISQGEKSLKYMLERFSGSNADGIEEYIMAAACSKILKQNPYTRRWNTGREWYDNYIRFLYNNPYATGNHDPITNPIYKSNKYKPLAAFLTKTEILKRIHKNHSRKEKWEIASIELKTYREYKFEDVPDKFDYGFMIDPDRMVWVVVTIYPDGYHGKRGFTDNAATISILDSETGDIMEFYVYGDIKVHRD